MRKSRNSAVILFCLLIFAVGTSVRAQEGALAKGMKAALENKEAGKIPEAVLSLEEALKDEAIKKDGYIRGYLQVLIKCLQADFVTYMAMIKETNRAVQDTRSAFLSIAEELKTSELSRKSIETINRMKQNMSRTLVTHSFCVPPANYEKQYQASQQALYQYEKAWSTLAGVTQEKDKAKQGPLQIQALQHFQRANNLFSMASSILERIKP